MTALDIEEFAQISHLAGGDVGDKLLRYRGHDLPSQHITAGDVLVVQTTGTAEPGDLVVVEGDGGVAHLVKFEEGLAILGRVVGVMRRLA